jgi:hypothetical protein
MFDAGPPDALPDAPQFPPCPIDPAPNASVAGTTPQGSFNGRFAWLGKAEGECSSSIFIVVSEVSDMMPRSSFAKPSPPLLQFYRRGSSASGVALGAMEGEVTFVAPDRRETRTQGTVNLTYAEFPGRNASPARAEGGIELVADGFTISGRFVAPYCGWMDIYCP